MKQKQRKQSKRNVKGKSNETMRSSCKNQAFKIDLSSNYKLTTNDIYNLYTTKTIYIYTYIHIPIYNNDIW